VVEGEYTILVTNPQLACRYKPICTGATLYYLTESDSEDVWDEARNCLQIIGGRVKCYIFTPWEHGSDRAITAEALLIERLQDCLAKLPGGVEILDELFQRQLPVFNSKLNF
jgi:hypothetical protein